MSMRTDAMDQKYESTRSPFGTRAHADRKSNRKHLKSYLRTVRTDEIDEPANAPSIFAGLIDGAL
jgi:hypothetical protein